MRASKAGLTGADGQLAVERQFVGLNWGVARNPIEHDLGTDLWVMARDERLFDLGAMLGVQVKTGQSWFRSPKQDSSGQVFGWWFADSDGEHFKYWRDHNVPHILVLHDPESGKSYWVSATADRFVSTGRGSKILVPADQVIDEAHLPALLEAALGQRKPSQWEGSAFQRSEPILRPDRLRYALLTPRLIAPHPNRTVEGYEADEAIALLAKMRIRELSPSKSPYRETKAPDLEQCRASTDWEWRFYASLHAALIGGGDGGIDAIQDLIDATDARPHERAAAAAAASSLLVESGQPGIAVELLDRLIAADVCGPTDHAWLLLHRARCLAELGDLQQALELAVEVQGLRAVAPHDPAAMAIVGAAADLIFSASSWVSGNVADAVTGRDTLAAWWRTQEVAWGLQEKAREDFREWADDERGTARGGASDQTWLHLRAATLIAGFTGDHTAWRAASSMLAQRVIATADSETGALVPALTLLRHTGDTDSLKLAIRRLLRTGPVRAVQEAAKAIDLKSSTRTGLYADITAIRESADVLTAEEAGRHMRWAIEVLENPSALAERLHPNFAILDAVLAMLAEVVPVLPASDLREVLDHLIALPVQADQAIAHGYAAVVGEIPTTAWSDDDLAALKNRPPDNFELERAFRIVLAAANEELRGGLKEQIANGDLAALEAFGDVRDLDSQTAARLVAKLSEKILQEVQELRSGQSAIRTYSFAATLVLINHWHPEQANWGPVLDLLRTARNFSSHLKRPLENLRNLSPPIPEDLAVELEEILRSVMTRPPTAMTKFMGNPDVRGDAAAALETIRPSAVGDTELWDLMDGSENQRAGAAIVLGLRRQPENRNVLAALARDTSQWVRAVVANQLMGWIHDDVAAEEASFLVCRIIAGSGTQVAKMVAVRLNGLPRTPAADRVVETLESQSSVYTGQQVEAYRSAAGRDTEVS